MLQICILDDQQSFLDELEKLIRVYLIRRKMKFHILATTDPEEVVKKNKQFHLIFLDIEMGEHNGISLGNEIRAVNRSVFLCFVTFHAGYAIDSYDCHAFDYILKPVNQNKIDNFFDDLYTYFLRNEEHESRTFHTTAGVTTLLLSDIIYFEYVSQSNIHLNRVVVMKTKDKEYLIRKKISELFVDLNSDDFYVPHKSFIINMSNIYQIKGEGIVMINGDLIPISHKKVSETKKQYLNFLEYQGNGTLI